MSYMSDLAMKAEALVIDAMSEPGVMSDTDVLEYVNERMPIEVSLSFVESVLDKFFGDEWETDYDVSSYN